MSKNELGEKLLETTDKVIDLFKETRKELDTCKAQKENINNILTQYKPLSPKDIDLPPDVKKQPKQNWWDNQWETASKWFFANQDTQEEQTKQEKKSVIKKKNAFDIDDGYEETDDLIEERKNEEIKNLTEQLTKIRQSRIRGGKRKTRKRRSTRRRRKSRFRKKSRRKSRCKKHKMKKN